MGDATEAGYKPRPEFQVDTKAPLVELNMTDSTELWFIQWPINHPHDLDGQEVTLELHHDGKLGSCEGSTGKSYDVVSFSAQHPDATVFSSSESGSEIVGKISRRVSFIRYPGPSEFQRQNTGSILKQTSQRSSGVAFTNSVPTTPQSMRRKKSLLISGNAASTHSSRQRSSLSEEGELSKPAKRMCINEPTRSLDPLAQTSQGHSAVESSGSLEYSQGKEAKKKKKN